MSDCGRNLDRVTVVAHVACPYTHDCRPMAAELGRDQVHDQDVAGRVEPLGMGETTGVLARGIGGVGEDWEIGVRRWFACS